MSSNGKTKIIVTAIATVVTVVVNVLCKLFGIDIPTI